ncbi:hypothetical protein CGA21_05310 [Pseudomonas sp. PSB11]|nr:hypothetical protein [Pseudomonas sp. PSB11]
MRLEQQEFDFVNRPNATSKTVVLQDGRAISIRLGEDLRILDSDGAKINLNTTFLSEENELHASIFRVLYGTLATHSLVYNHTIIRALKSWLTIEQMSDVALLELTHIESLVTIPLDYRSFILPVLRRIQAQKLAGLSPDVRSFLTSGHQWEERGTGAYYSLITNDPTCGALTSQELHNIHGALNHAYAHAKISKSTFTLCWFFIATGVRPIQVVRMKISDVQIASGPEGKEVTLRIPLAKGDKTSTQEYWLRRAPTVLAECLINYLDSEFMSERPKDSPLFDGNSNVLSKRIINTFDSLDTYSERLEGQIPVNAYRFRYTMATRALIHGASDFEVARLLTHRGTSCIQFYRASMPELQKPIRQALGDEMDYFAKAFQGKLINSLGEATRAGEESSVIADFLRLAGQSLGACGTRAECHQNAPIACLYCPFFEPLEEAPWEELLASLKDDQAVESDSRIRQINHNAMSAINEIIVERDNRQRIAARELHG